MSIPRRSFLGCLALQPILAAEPAAETLCHFHARASILVFSVPIFHRDNVGSAYLRIAERLEEGRRLLKLEFGAGSIPEKAAGLNRLGVFEESIVQDRDSIESAQYFGFISSSSEKDLNEARAALNRAGAVSFTAVHGSILRGRLVNRLLKITDLPALGWNERQTLRDRILARFSTPAAPPVNSILDAPGCSPFLHALRTSMLAPDPSSSRPFVHNGLLHRLQTKKSPAPGGAVELYGRIESPSGTELSSFRLWFDPARPELGPSRFEFRPRTFLRLRFDRA